MQTPAHPHAESVYLASAAERLREALGHRAVGMYAGGSWALGDYVPGPSDLDVAVVVRRPLTDELADAVVAGLRHESLPCPARKLELVVYRLGTASSASAAADFELNLNTGADAPLSVQSDGTPDEVAPHWFPIDRSILSQAGIALWGPPAGETFAPIPRGVLSPVIVESVRWHRRHAGATADGVLNACRGLRFVHEGHWSSKPAAARWAVASAFAPARLVARACRARTEQVTLDPGEVARFLSAVESRLERATA